MLGPAFGAVVSCALGASAFLIPPNIEALRTPKNNEAATRSFFTTDPKHNLFTVPCPSCDWSYDEGADPSPTKDNMILIDLSIDEDNKGLLANGIFIYPHEEVNSDPWNSITNIVPHQIPGNTTREQLQNGDYPSLPLTLGWSGVVEVPQTKTLGYTYHSVHWKMSGLNKKYMDDLPMIFIELLRSDTDGELMIMSLAISPSEVVDYALDEKVEEPAIINTKIHVGDVPAESLREPCRGASCAWRKLFGETFGTGRRPCPGRAKFDGEHLPSHIRPHFGQPPPVKFGGMADAISPFHEEGDRPEDMPRHRHHHDRHHRRGWFHFISRSILAVLIPIMAGITVGIVVSVTGLLFGRMLGYLWFTAFRGGRRGYASVAAEERMPVDVKTTASTPDQTLPPYEDAPSYEQDVKT